MRSLSCQRNADQVVGCSRGGGFHFGLDGHIGVRLSEDSVRSSKRVDPFGSFAVSGFCNSYLRQAISTPHPQTFLRLEPPGGEAPFELPATLK